MIEVCGYCKDTHGRHFLGCPYLAGQAPSTYNRQQNEEIAKWRSKHGYTEKLPLRTDGIHTVEECGKVPVGHEYQGVRGPAEVWSEGGFIGVGGGAKSQPPMSNQPKIDVREFVKTLEENPKDIPAPYKELNAIQRDALQPLIDRHHEIYGKTENPKDVAGKSKPAFNLLALPAALSAMAKVMKHGADKYGPFNWRSIPITSSAYFAAIGRHWAAMASGEWLDSESGEPHAAHIMATCAIMLDAKAHGTMKE